MNEFVNNDASEMLTQLLDGELAAEQEQFLYDRLASDKHLQSQMRDVLSIRETIRNDQEAFLPPPHLKNAVFSKIGITTTAATASKTAMSGSYPYIIAFSVFLLALLPIIYLAMTDFDSSKTPNIVSLDADQSVLAAQDNITISENNINTTVSNEKHNVKHSLNSNFPKNVPVTINHSDDLPADVSDESIAALPINSSENESTERYITSAEFALNDNAFANNWRNISPNSPVSLSNSIKNRWDFPFRAPIGNKTRTINIRGIYPFFNGNNELSSDLSKSFTVAALISSDLSPNLDLGVEFGLEGYLQEYMKDQDGQYEQDATVMWLGIAAKYNFTNLSTMGITPFAQIVVGGSDVGPLARGLIGLSYFASKNIGINIGFESSLLLYKKDNIYYGSDKFGLSGGILYRF